MEVSKNPFFLMYDIRMTNEVTELRMDIIVHSELECPLLKNRGK